MTDKKKRRGILEIQETGLKVRDSATGELFHVPKSNNRDEYFLPGDGVEFLWDGKRTTITSNNKDGKLFTIGKLLEINDKIYFKAFEKNINIFIPKNNIYYDMYGKENGISLKPGTVVSGNILHKKNTTKANLKLNIKLFLGHESDSKIETAISKELYDLEFKKIKKDNLLNYLDYNVTFSDIRDDLTDIHFISIDNETTKDIDDAVFAIRKDNNNINLKVAIADAAHYIAKNSELDHVAYEKTSTIYFPQGTEHMIPTEISTDICSLNPYNIKKAIVCDIDIQLKPFQITNYKFIKANIVSHRKTSYDEIDEYILNKKNPFSLSVSQNIECLNVLLNECPYIQNKHPQDYYDNIETYLKLDKSGKINHIQAVNTNTPAHKIIETAMVIANKCAADFMFKESKYGFFRHLSTKENIPSVYSFQPNNDTEFENYTHFTSPIRRYSDLVVHRIINSLLQKTPTPYTEEELGNIALHINEKQKIIKKAITKTKNQLIYEYAKRLIGQEDQAHIVEITDKGYKVIAKTFLIDTFIVKGIFPKIDSLLKTQEINEVPIFMKITDVDEFNEKIKVSLYTKNNNIV